MLCRFRPQSSRTCWACRPRTAIGSIGGRRRSSPVRRRGWAALKAFPHVWLFLRFIRRLIRTKRGAQTDDLLSALIQAEEAGDRLNDDELVAMSFLLLVAGHETTVNLIGSGMLALMQHPDQMDRLRTEPALIKPAVEELLRFGSPVETATERFARGYPDRRSHHPARQPGPGRARLGQSRRAAVPKSGPFGSAATQQALVVWPGPAFLLRHARSPGSKGRSRSAACCDARRESGWVLRPMP